MAADQNISKFPFEVVSGVVTVYFSYLFSFVFHSECPASPEPTRRFLTITGGLYHFVTGNRFWIFTMMATASEESLEKFV